MRVALALTIALECAFAQGLEPRSAAADYPAHTAIGTLSIGAEFLARALPSPDGYLNTRGYLVVEVAIYGPALPRTVLSQSHFSLRVNGNKQGILAQPPFIAASAFEPPIPGYGTAATITQGNRRVIIGDAPPAQRPFPEDRGRPPERRTPEPPPPLDTGNVPRKQPIEPAEAVKRAALPTGELKLPQAGVIFFAYPGDLEKINALELIYDGPAGLGAIKLR